MGSANPLKICGISQQDIPGAFNRIARFTNPDIAQQRALFAFLKAVDPGMKLEVAREAVKCVLGPYAIKLSNGAGEQVLAGQRCIGSRQEAHTTRKLYAEHHVWTCLNRIVSSGFGSLLISTLACRIPQPWRCVAWLAMHV
jgi:hypothetical protein